MFWKLFGSNQKVEEALRRGSRAQDLTPSMAVNDDAPPLDENGQPRRLWLEGWNEQDEARLRDDREDQFYFA